MNTPMAIAPYSSTSLFSRSLRDGRGLAGGVACGSMLLWLTRRAFCYPLEVCPPRASSGALFERRLSRLGLRPVRVIMSPLRIGDEHAARRAERLAHRLVGILPPDRIGRPAAHRQLAPGDVQRDVTLELAT